MQKILRGIFHPYRLMLGTLALLLVMAILFPPVYVSEPGFSDVHLEWKLRFIAARLPGEQLDVFFLSLEITALATLAAWLHQARHAWSPRLATEARSEQHLDRIASAEHGSLLNRF